MKATIFAGLATAASAQRFSAYPTCRVDETVPPFQIATPDLCGTPNEAEVTEIKKPENPCQDSEIYGFNFAGCCDNDFGASQTKERYAYVSQTALQCAGKFTISTEEMVPGKIDACCESCKCYGDPHCKSFNDVEETWVTCDTRVYKNPGESNECRGTRVNTAEHRLECSGGDGAVHQENAGGKCVYKSAPNWDWKNLGSRCQLAPDFKPTMEMYGNELVELSLEMGERGVITRVFMEEKDTSITYILDAKNGPEGCAIWYTEDGDGVQTPVAEGDLPTGWQMEEVEVGELKDLFWALESDVAGYPSIFVQCLGYQESRPDIDQRLNVKLDQGIGLVDENDTGFCPTSVIAERPENYPNILCSTESAPYQAEFAANCMSEFEEYCNGTLPETTGRFNTYWSQNDPIHEVFKWCQYNWCLNRQLPETPGDEGLKECVDDVMDFKFEGAARFYPEKVEDSECVVFEMGGTRPTDDCVDGFDLQYCPAGETCPEDGTANWVSHSWIPIQNYCNGSISFFREDNEGLFEGPVRIAQVKCNSFGAQCNSWAKFVGEMEWATPCYELAQRLELPASEGGWELYTAGGEPYSFELSTCTDPQARRLLGSSFGPGPK